MDSARIKVDVKNPRPLPGGGSDSKRSAISPDENVDCSPVKVINSTLLVLIVFSSVLFAFLHIFLYAANSSSATDPSQNYHQPLPVAMAARKSISAGDVLNKSCSVTLYPEFCLSSLSRLPAVRGATTDKEILVASVKDAARLAKKALVKFDGILVQEGKRKSNRRWGALNVCVQTMDVTIFNLQTVLTQLGTRSSSGHPPPSANGSSPFSWHENEVKEYLSAALADHDTCMDSLKELKAMKKHLNEVKKHMDPIYKMVSNSLCMVKDLIAKEKIRLAGHGGGGGETDALFSSHNPRDCLSWWRSEKDLNNIAMPSLFWWLTGTIFPSNIPSLDQQNQSHGLSSLIL